MFSTALQNTDAYAFEEMRNIVLRLKEQGITPIDFGVGIPSEPTPSFVNDALLASLSDYTSVKNPISHGRKAFRESAQQYMKRRFGVSLDATTQITSTLGSKEAVFHFSLAFLNPGDTVIIPTPGYPPMRAGAMFAHANIFTVGLWEENNFLIDYQSIPESVAQKAKMLWLNYPNAPTGAVASLEYYRGLVSWAEKYNIILACDEGCYSDIYCDGNEPPHSILEVSSSNIIAFYSLSKRANMTGYRVGFACGDAELVKGLRLIKTHLDAGTPDFIQSAAIAALDDDMFVKTMRTEYTKKRAALIPALENFGLLVSSPPATFYLWQKVPSGMTGKEFAKQLLSPELAIVTTPGSLISHHDDITGKNPGEKYVRFALVPTLPEVEEASRRIFKKGGH